MDDRRTVLSVDTLSKSFKVKNAPLIQALDAVSLTVRSGGITALVGPDGAGKTTLLRIVAGLLVPDAGALALDGAAGQRESLPDAIGYMPQKFGLYEDLTIRENLDLYADLRGLGTGEARERRYRELLAMASLEPFSNRLAGKLSGGMKQKLGLICTLVRPPKLLLLDEPTVGVDPLSRRELWNMVAALARDEDMSVLMSTSYMDEAERCDEVVLLYEGKTLARGTPAAIRALSEGMGYIARPAGNDAPHALQAGILDAGGIIDAVPQGGAVRFVHGDLNTEQQKTLEDLLRGAEVRRAAASLEDSFMLLLHRHTGEREHGGETAAFPSGPGKTSVTKTARLMDAEISAHATEPADGEEPIIQTRNVSRLFGDFIAVNDVSFSVRRGEVFGLLGPNGAGKTTTFRMLCGLLPPSSGSLYVAGVDVREGREEARRRLGYVAQKFSLYGPLSVRENLEFFAGAYGLRGEAGRERVREAVADFSLERHLDTPAGDLPGGWKQRLAMAVGLLHKPAILFLDEPTSGADPQARRAFWKRISGLAAGGVTIVVTTHFMEEAEYCDRVLIQDSGVMLAMDTPANIRAQAVSEPGRDVTMEDAFIAIVEKARNGKQGQAA